MSAEQKYCLDTNVLIEAWNRYYSPKICPSYWEILNQLGAANRIFVPKMVADEIFRTEDDLCAWLKTSTVPVYDLTGPVTNAVRTILAAHPTLVDNTKQRSLADPWVIAHAMVEGAHVVTKEDKVTAANSARVRIPNVCDSMNVRWLNDFQFLEETNIHFTCAIK